MVTAQVPLPECGGAEQWARGGGDGGVDSFPRGTLSRLEVLHVYLFAIDILH